MQKQRTGPGTKKSRQALIGRGHTANLRTRVVCTSHRFWSDKIAYTSQSFLHVLCLKVNRFARSRTAPALVAVKKVNEVSSTLARRWLSLSTGLKADQRLVPCSHHIRLQWLTIFGVSGSAWQNSRISAFDARASMKTTSAPWSTNCEQNHSLSLVQPSYTSRVQSVEASTMSVAVVRERNACKRNTRTFPLKTEAVKDSTVHRASAKSDSPALCRQKVT